MICEANSLHFIMSSPNSTLLKESFAGNNEFGPLPLLTINQKDQFLGQLYVLNIQLSSYEEF